MKCPYCGKETETGLIQSPNAINWIKGERRRMFSGSILHPNAVTLSDYSLLGAAVVAHLCRECQKVIIDLADEQSNLNNR